MKMYDCTREVVLQANTQIYKKTNHIFHSFDFFQSILKVNIINIIFKFQFKLLNIIEK